MFTTVIVSPPMANYKLIMSLKIARWTCWHCIQALPWHTVYLTCESLPSLLVVSEYCKGKFSCRDRLNNFYPLPLGSDLLKVRCKSGTLSNRGVYPTTKLPHADLQAWAPAGGQPARIAQASRTIVCHALTEALCGRCKLSFRCSISFTYPIGLWQYVLRRPASVRLFSVLCMFSPQNVFHK